MSLPEKTLPFFHPAKFIGTWFGVGLSPKAPGTMGSIAALPFAYTIQLYGGNMALFIAAVIAFIVGMVACEKYLPYTDALDPREMVIDEVHGQWLLLSLMPATLVSYGIGLALFRLFDILKPWPISLADRKIHGGFGVMFDDTLAAVYPIALAWLASCIGQWLGYPHVMESIHHFLSMTYVF
jgi:phosphatidylglycerophosphatase A